MDTIKNYMLYKQNREKRERNRKCMAVLDSYKACHDYLMKKMVQGQQEDDNTVYEINYKSKLADDTRDYCNDLEEEIKTNTTKNIETRWIRPSDIIRQNQNILTGPILRLPGWSQVWSPNRYDGLVGGQLPTAHELPKIIILSDFRL